MKLIEADGKRLLGEAGIACPPSVFLGIHQDPTDLSAIGYPAYFKAQVLQGRRGQRGLVKRVTSPGELSDAVVELRHAVADIPCAGFLLEPDIAHISEWLLAIDVDGASGRMRMSFSEQGGMGVSRVQSLLVDSAEDILQTGVPVAIRDVLVKMFQAFQAHDLISLEINPLAVLADGSCVALDAKAEVDDAAAFRHPERAGFHVLSGQGREPSSRETDYARLLDQAGYRGTLGRYVELDGDIALILSGGGASLVALDALKNAGGHAANYVEMSGNPDPEQVRLASKIVLSKPGIRGVWIAGSFANFTDIQATVNAVLLAAQDIGLRAPIVIRRDGPNAEAARRDALRWAEEQGVFVRFDRADVDFDQSALLMVEAASRI